MADVAGENRTLLGTPRVPSWGLLIDGVLLALSACYLLAVLASWFRIQRGVPTPYQRW